MSKLKRGAKSILTLDHESAMNFFMKSERFHGFELPSYFVFDDVLQSVRESVGDRAYEDCLRKNVSPEDLSDVNLDILLNKDGRYAVRPIILANPYLYYFLVRELCDERGWTVVKDLFSKFRVPNVTSCALPVVSKKRETFHKSTTILNWWNSMEQRTIELSLEYRYMFVTDITNCYGSINPQSIEWAFQLKGTSFETDANVAMARNVQKYLRAFQQGRNIGIPQGNAIFDFVAEIVLGYSDLLLREAIRRAGIDVPFEILRYRDDYRIFCNNKDKLEQISYILQQVLEGLNFRMNSQKTMVSDSIILDSVKPDKLFYIFNTPIVNKNGADFSGLQKHLLYILMFGRKYPNGGQLRVMLSQFDQRVQEKLKEVHLIPVKPKKSSEDSESSNIFNCYDVKIYREVTGLLENVRAMSAICAQIALENVSASHYALRVLSRMVDSLDDEQEKSDIIDKVYEKLCHQPNSTYNQLWLQNITLQQDKLCGHSRYKVRLCKVAAGESDVVLWNNEWLLPSITENLKSDQVVDHDILMKTTPVINFRENRMYDDGGDCEVAY